MKVVSVLLPARKHFFWPSTRSPGLLALCALAMIASFLVLATSPGASAQSGCTEQGPNPWLPESTVQAASASAMFLNPTNQSASCQYQWDSVQAGDTLTIRGEQGDMAYVRTNRNAGWGWINKAVYTGGGSVDCTDWQSAPWNVDEERTMVAARQLSSRPVDECADYTQVGASETVHVRYDDGAGWAYVQTNDRSKSGWMPTSNLTTGGGSVDCTDWQSAPWNIDEAKTMIAARQLSSRPVDECADYDQVGASETVHVRYDDGAGWAYVQTNDRSKSGWMPTSNLTTGGGSVDCTDWQSAPWNIDEAKTMIAARQLSSRPVDECADYDQVGASETVHVRFDNGAGWSYVQTNDRSKSGWMPNSNLTTGGSGGPTPTPTPNTGTIPARMANAEDPMGVLDGSAAWANNNHENTSQSTLDSWFNTDNLGSLPGNANVGDYFDASSGLAGNNGNEGAFRIYCSVSHFQQVDPIVSPNAPSHHLHMFWGNHEASASSEVGSGGATDLAENGESTCQGGVYNRSAYWMPALQTTVDGADHVVLPDNLFMYYKSKVDLVKADGSIETVNPLPLGIELLGGKIDMPRDRVTQASYGGGMIPFNRIHDPDFVNWSCYAGEGSVEVKLQYIPSSETCRKMNGNGCSTYVYNGVCNRYTYLEAQIRFPQCLAEDGNGNPVVRSEDLDANSTPATAGAPWATDDNVSHTYARMSWNENQQYYCPASHPYRIPQITYRVRYKIPGSQNWKQLADDGLHYTTQTDTLANYVLSCDDHGSKPTTMGPDGHIRGWCLHGDWFGAWNEKVVKEWTNNCFQQTVQPATSRVGKNCANGVMNSSSIKLSMLDGTRDTGGAGKSKYDGDTHGWTRSIATAATVPQTAAAHAGHDGHGSGGGSTPEPPPPPPPPVTPPTNEAIRTAAMTEIVGALEQYAVANGTFKVTGGGSKGNGQGWFHYDGNVNYTKAVSTVLAEAGYLDANDLPLGPLHQDNKVVDDFVIYRCQDFIGVFSRGNRDSRSASAADQATWADPDNRCTAYPTGRFGSTYYLVSRTLAELRDAARTAAMTEIVGALEQYAVANGTYTVSGGGWGGNGQGWYHYDANDKYPASVNSVLTADGYLNAGDPPYGPLHRDDSVTDDFLVYRCKDFIGVFSRRDTRSASAADQAAWSSNGCTTYPTERLASTYYMVATPRSDLQATHDPNGRPYCASAASDPDGDGWGYENNQSCVVRT